MKIKNMWHYIVAGIAAFCIIYIIFALQPLSTELHLIPEWTQDISRIEEAKEDDILIPYKLGLNIGYFTPDGRVVSTISYPVKASVSSSYYAYFGADSKDTKFYSPNGALAGTIHEAGFPFFDDDRVFLFQPGGSSFIRCSQTGDRLWGHESYAPITAFASCDKGVVAGYADGALISFSPDGKVDQNFFPDDSSLPVIMGVDISNNGSIIAAVCGQERQRFIVAEKYAEQHSKIIFHEYLDKSSIKQVPIRFSKDDNTVYYHYNGGLGIVNLKKSKSSHIPISGRIIQIEESDDADNKLVFALSKDRDTYEITIIEPFDNPVARFSFKAQSSFIQVRGHALFIGRNNKISRLTISRK